MQEVLVKRLGGLSLPRKSVVRLTDRPEMTLNVYRGRKTTTQQQQPCGIAMLHLFQQYIRTITNLFATESRLQLKTSSAQAGHELGTARSPE